MKVVLFCGGLGTRLREHSETIPKPLVTVGYRPIIWHLMRYYAHFGHKDFVLCLGYRGDMIREYFLNYHDCMSNDFVLSLPSGQVKPLNSDIEDWRITFVDTGMHSNLGQRLMRVRHLLQDERCSSPTTPTVCPTSTSTDHIAQFQRSDATASFLAVRPAQSFHTVSADAAGMVQSIEPIHSADVWVNGGYFCLRNSVFDAIKRARNWSSSRSSACSRSAS